MADTRGAQKSANVGAAMLTPSHAPATAARNRTFPIVLPMPCLALAVVCLVIALAIDAATPPAAAAVGVWKCQGRDRVPVYQDKPCDPGSELKDLTAEPPALSVVPLAIPSEAARQRPAAKHVDKPPARPRRAEAPAPRGDANERRFVHEGMSEGEVLLRLGPPDLASPKSARKARWTFLPAPGDPQTMTLVQFEDGRVVHVERRVVR